MAKRNAKRARWSWKLSDMETVTEKGDSFYKLENNLSMNFHFYNFRVKEKESKIPRPGNPALIKSYLTSCQ